MDKAIAICLTALLLLSGCLSASDDDELVSIIGCDDETSLTYNENATESNEELCASEDLIESAIVDFINMMDEGIDYDEVYTTMGYTMEVSNGDEGWNYMETLVMSPNTILDGPGGLKITSESTEGSITTIEEMIFSGNEIQYTVIDDGESMQVRMKHTGTHEDAMEMIFSDDEEDREDGMVCHDMSTHTNDYSIDNQEDCEDAGHIWTEDTGHSDDTEGRQTTQITSLDISQDNGIVTIAITGDFSDDPATAPYYTMMLIKNGNDPEYALTNIQEEDNYNSWDYLEAGYAEINIPTDWLLGGNYFDVVFSVWLESQSSDSAVSSQFTFYVPESDDNSDDGDAEMVCYDIGSHTVLSDIDNAADCEDGDYMWVEADSGPDDHSDDDHGDDDEMDMGDDGEDPESSDYTDYYNPLTATFTGFENTESGMTFSGLLNVEDAPFGLLEVYTLDDFTVTGFALIDVEDSSNWAKFMLIYDGSTSVDQTLALEALPFVLIDMDMSDDERDEDEDHDGHDHDDGDHDEGGYCYDEEEDTVWWEWDADTMDESNCTGPGLVWIPGNDHDDEDHDDDEPIFYDGCTESTDPEDSYYECWMNDWVDSDGNIIESDGYDMDECTDLDPGWECYRNYDADTGWSFDRGIQDCDSNNDTMVSYDELDYCVTEDLANDGYGHMNASDVHAYDEFNMSDMNNDSMLNESEFGYLNSMLSHSDDDPNYQEMFSMMDSDEDGEVTFSEWQDMNNQSDEPMPEDELDRFALIINFFDENNSGGLDLSEFLNMMFTLDDEDGNMEENPEFLFAMMDSDSDGEVTLDEWVASSNDSDDGPMSQEEIDGLSNMIDMFDDDDSMGLDYSEFEAMMESMNNGDMEDNPEFLFNMIDANDDGEVTASEWADASNQSEDEEPMSDEDFEMFSAMINNFDSDSSGGLDFEEFTQMMDEMDGEGDDMQDMKMLMVMGLDGLGGDLDDYSLVLSQCDQFEHSSGFFMQNENCGDDVYSVTLSSIVLSQQEAMFSTQAIIFMDMDESGTLTTGDMFMIDISSLDLDEDWNAARLHSEEADAYSDENPMAMPGFTGILATIGLLGAALIRRD